MIREDQLVRYLEEAGGCLSSLELQSKMGLSDNTIRSTVRIVNLNQERDGLHVVRERGVGYRLIIDDNSRYDAYRARVDCGLDITNAQSRASALLYYLLQQRGWSRIDDLTERLGLSRTTLLKDLEQVEALLADQNLGLERRRHYGLRVRGNEQAVRRAFTRYVVEAKLDLEPLHDYQQFKDRIDNPEFKNRIYSVLASNHIVVSDLAFGNIFEHYVIMLYRISQQDAVLTVDFGAEDIREAYRDAAHEIAEGTWRVLGIELPEAEVDYLALGIQSKSTIDMLPVTERGAFRTEIESILDQLDRAYGTSFSTDATLIDSLVLHIVPLLTRVTHDLQLRNPVLEQIRAGYANVYTITLRFVEALRQKFALKDLTEDEIGFIALHLAASSERERKRQIGRIKRIVAICTTGAGTAALIKIKLRSMFPQAEIATVSEHALTSYEGRLPDLFLSTIPCGASFHGVPVIHVKNLLDEDELRRVEDVIAVSAEHHDLEESSLDIAPLFRKVFFQVLPGGSYMEIVERQARAMVDGGCAYETFPAYVVQREEKYPTVFKGGVATPHPIRLDAPENVVGVTILERPVEHAGREVQLIFLINLKADSLYLHTEVQKTILKIIDQDDLRRRILSCRSFESFLWELRKIRS